MENFSFYLDVKRIVWERTNIIIGAESAEEARTKALELYHSNNLLGNDEVLGDTDTLLETSEDMTVEENKGRATVELFEWKGDKLLAANSELTSVVGQ